MNLCFECIEWVYWRLSGVSLHSGGLWDSRSVWSLVDGFPGPGEGAGGENGTLGEDGANL